MRNLLEGRQRWMKVRLCVLAFVLSATAVLVVARAYTLQVEQADMLGEMAEEQYLRDTRLSPKRGTIYDRNGAELAVSVDVESVWANPRQLKASGVNPAEATRLIASVIDIDIPRIQSRLESDRYFVWIKRRITPQQEARVRELEISGVNFESEARRYYPNRELAAHVLGYANVDGEGIEGLELSLNQQLRGSVNSVPAIRDRRGKIVFSEQLLDDRAAQGDDVHLTIDKTIQHISERELALAAQTFEAKAASIVVMDPRNGEILALANYPTFNPNRPGGYAPSVRRNRAVTDFFEPGSTVKPFTVAGAFARGTIRTDQLIDCENGSMEVGEYVIHDSHPFSELTPAQILAHSSNICTAKIGGTLGRQGLFRTLRRFGFGEETGLPLPGEAEGILRHSRRWFEMDAATIAFGQGMSVTNVQMATAMTALANRGKLMRPILVRRVTDTEDETIEETLPQSRRQAVDERTARLVADMLTAVTGPGGTGIEASIDGYLVAGKTGTAQKADYMTGGYAADRWLASFVGFVPADNPRLVISVVVDEPVIAHYGGVVAGPVFRRVGEASLRHLGVPRAGGGEALALAQRATQARQAAARERERERRREVRRARRENRDVRPSFESQVAFVTERISTETPGEGEVRVPDLSGHTARAVFETLHAKRLRVDLLGSGVVVEQLPVAGSVVPSGSRVQVTLAIPNWERDEAGIPSDLHVELTSASVLDEGSDVELAGVGSAQ